MFDEQVSPKSCGHFGGKQVVSREEALTRIKAAVDARSEALGDIVIIARSDARQAESLEEALWRVQKFAELGADVVFVDALASKDELRAFCKVASNTPKMVFFVHSTSCEIEVIFLSPNLRMAFFSLITKSTQKFFVIKQANMLEGGGRTPILTPLELEELGFKLVAYPLSLVGVSMRAMQVSNKAQSY